MTDVNNKDDELLEGELPPALKAAIEKTDLYDKIIKMTLKQSSTGCDIPDKAAKAHAYKITLAHYNKKDSESES